MHDDRRYFMKKKIMGIMILLVCLCLIVLGRTASAASVSVEKIAYVDTVTKSLVLKFTEFSEDGYTYTVKNMTTGQQLTGSVASKVTSFSLPLGDSYVADTKYKLVLKGKNNEELTVYYYTGDAVSGLNMVKNADESLRVSWNLQNGSLYQGYYVQLAENADSPQASVVSKAEAGNQTSKTLTADLLTSRSYRVYVIGYRKVGKNLCYGQGIEGTFNYAKKPEKVLGVSAVPNSNRAKLSWLPVTGASYYRIYKSTKSSGKYTLAMDKVTKTSATVTGLTGGKKYYFKVAAVGAAGSRKAVGKKSSAVSASIPVVAGQVKKVKLMLDSDNKLALTWNRCTNATGYRIYYKKAGETSYKKLANTKNKVYTLDALDSGTKYSLVVYAYTKVGSKKYLSSEPSRTITFTPSKYMNKHYNKLLANGVRTIGYVGKTKCIYTKKKYSKEVKTAFVNYKGYSSSTPYLIWISHYTQQVTIFEGTQRNWHMIRTFLCSTGKASTHSPIGVSKISYKEPGWFYENTKELYVSHYWGRNSFHTRPLWNSGAVQDPTIGKPASHGCVRCYNRDAKYIYDNIPIGTTVVSY